MGISTEISRISAARDKIRTKLVTIGLVESNAKLDTCATAVENIINRGGVSATVKEGETYTIQAGYHDGTGTVSGVYGDGKYDLQSKTVIPTKSQQQVTPDSGYYGLSDVMVNAIPEAYQDVSGVTAVADDILAGKTIVASTGAVTPGTMSNNGAVERVLDTSTTSYTIPKGYHSGAGTVSIVLEEKSATPTKAEQVISPAIGKVISKVTVNAIPEEYQDVSAVTATAADVLAGKKIVVADGNVIDGAMASNGAINATIDGLVETSYAVPAGYTTGGTVSLTGDIEDALAAI